MIACVASRTLMQCDVMHVMCAHVMSCHLLSGSLLARAKGNLVFFPFFLVFLFLFLFFVLYFMVLVFLGYLSGCLVVFL